MNTTLVSLTMILLMFFFSSCSKNDSEELPPVSPRPLMSKLTVHHGSQVFSYTFRYDYKSRLSRLEYSTGMYRTYSYSDTSVSVTFFTSDGDQKALEYYKLNSVGLATSANILESGSASLWSVEYEYDNNGYLRKKQFTSSGTVYAVQEKISNGNAIVETRYYASHTDSSCYTFIPGSLNTIGDENMGIYFLGKQNLSLYDIQTEVSNGNGPIQIRYSYAFDDKNRVSKYSETLEGFYNDTTFCEYIE